MTESGMTKPTRGIALLVVGIIMTVIGVIAMIAFGWGTPGKDTALNNALWESLLTIGSSVFAGVGILLIVIAIVRRRSRASRMRDGSPSGGSGGVQGVPNEPAGPSDGTGATNGRDPHDTSQHRH